MIKNWKLVVVSLVLGTLAWGAGDAGCGLGSLIISKNSKGLQLLALTTNGSFSSQPLGITSGTSNCSSSGIVSTEKEIQYYVEVNKNEITRQMAMGQGEKMDTLASLYGCQKPESKEQFRSLSKSQFQKIVSSADTSATQLISNLNTMIQNDSVVSKVCSRI